MHFRRQEPSGSSIRLLRHNTLCSTASTFCTSIWNLTGLQVRPYVDHFATGVAVSSRSHNSALILLAFVYTEPSAQRCGSSAVCPAAARLRTGGLSTCKTPPTPPAATMAGIATVPTPIILSPDARSVNSVHGLHQQRAQALQQQQARPLALAPCIHHMHSTYASLH